MPPGGIVVVLALDVVQAAFGDCLVLRYGSVARPRALLIDGGPPGTYASHLRPVLQTGQQPAKRQHRPSNRATV